MDPEYRMDIGGWESGSYNSSSKYSFLWLTPKADADGSRLAGHSSTLTPEIWRLKLEHHKFKATYGPQARDI